MIEATRTWSGNAFLIRPSRGTHQSSVLSEMSSQFHDECSAAPARFFIERWGESASARRNFVFGPATLTTGCRPIVFVTTPPQPASNARRMFDSDSVGGADDSRNGFCNRIPVNVVDKSGPMAPPAPLKRRPTNGLPWRRASALRPSNRRFYQPIRLIRRDEDLVRVVETER